MEPTREFPLDQNCSPSVRTEVFLQGPFLSMVGGTKPGEGRADPPTQVTDLLSYSISLFILLYSRVRDIYVQIRKHEDYRHVSMCLG